MNYSRRPNRPDANYYRETRRRSIGRGRGGGKPLDPKMLLIAVVGAVAIVAYLLWK